MTRAVSCTWNRVRQATHAHGAVTTRQKRTLTRQNSETIARAKAAVSEPHSFPAEGRGLFTRDLEMDVGP